MSGFSVTGSSTEELLVLLLAPADPPCALYPSYLGFPTVSSPVLSMLLEPALFPWESLVLSFLPDSSEPARPSQGHYSSRWCPLFTVMIRSPCLVAHSHPLASWDYVALPIAQVSACARSRSGSAISHPFPRTLRAMHCSSLSHGLRTCMCLCLGHILCRF